MALTRINNQTLTNVTSAGLPSGSVVQMVTDTDSTQYILSGTDTTKDVSGLSVAITPKSTNNKFLVMFSGAAMVYGTSTQDHGIYIKLNGSIVYETGSYKADNTWTPFNLSATFVHDITSSGVHTFTLQMHRDGGADQQFRLNRDGSDSSLTVMEIAG